jgi:hypothetical protein
VSLADTACPSGSCDTEALRRLLEPLLSEVERLLRLCSDGLTARYLADTYVPQRLVTASATAPAAIQNPAGPSPNAPSRRHADHPITDRPVRRNSRLQNHVKLPMLFQTPPDGHPVY